MGQVDANDACQYFLFLLALTIIAPASKPSLSLDAKMDAVTPIKEEPLTSPKITAPTPSRQVSEIKETVPKAPSKKAEPKAKPPPPPPAPKESPAPPTAPAAIPLQPEQPTAPTITVEAATHDMPTKTMPLDHVKQCRRVWRKMYNHRSSAHFKVPVDPIAENIPHYPEIVKKPMDLSTIKTKLDTGKYGSLQHFDEDVRQMLSNCYKFNAMGSYVYNQGQELESVFESEWSSVAGAKVPEMNITIVETPKASPSTPPAVAHAPVKTGSGDSLINSKTSPTPSKKASTPKPTPVPAYVPPTVPLTERVPSPVPISSTSSSVVKEKPSVSSSSNHQATSAPSQPPAPPSKSSSSNRSSDMAKCKKIVKKLLTDPSAYEFSQPVDPVRQGIPLYFKIITHPMDLGTILQKLEADQYKSIAEVKEDLGLVITNCRKFNSRESYVVKQADALEQLTLKKWEAAFGSSSTSGANVSSSQGADSGASKDAPVAAASSTSTSTSTSTSGSGSGSGSGSSTKAKSKVTKPEKTEDTLKVPTTTTPAADGGTTGRRPSNTPKPKAKAVEKGVEPPKEVVDRYMEKILKKCVNHKHATPFLEPVCLSFLLACSSPLPVCS